jgi:hypothetical protein
MDSESKTVYRYDVRGTAFKKAAAFLLFLSAVLAIFGVYWIYSWN